jgi:HAD superfamily hydrolase (TIGR01509 family)
MKKIDTVIFDLADVCVRGFVGLEYVLSACTGRDPDKLNEALRGKRLNAVFEGRISEQEYLKGVLNDINLKAPLFFIKFIIRNNFREIRGTRSIVEGLKSNGYRIGLLSDHVKEWVEYIEAKHDFLQLFDGKFYSFDLRTTKKHTASFVYALDGLEADPDKTLFIDDTPENLEVALSAGIKHVHQFASADGLRKDLASYNINL